MKVNDTDLSTISDEQFERKYARIKKKILKNKNIVDDPIAVVLGGQPGAGKSNIYDIYKERLEGNIVELDCDAFRKYHPNYKKLYKIYGDNDGEKNKSVYF